MLNSLVLSQRQGSITLFGLRKSKKTAVEVFDSSLWNGERGKLLQAAGFKPTDKSNLVQFDSDEQVRSAQARVAHDLRLASENRKAAATHPGCALAAMFVFGESVWNGPSGSTLVEKLHFTPWDSFNVRFVAADERSSKILDLPRIYHGEISAVAKAANDILPQIFAEAKAADDFRQDAGGNVWGLANALWESYILPGLRD